jgi:hypothetical protein
MATSSWEDARLAINVLTPDQYISFVSQCPRIVEYIQIKWNNITSCWSYNNLQTASPDDIKRKYHHAVSQYNQLQTIVHQFETQTHNMKRRMDDIQSQFCYWDQFMDSTTKKASTTLQEQVTNHAKHLKEQSTQLLEKAYQDTASLITQKTQELSHTLDDMAHSL